MSDTARSTPTTAASNHGEIPGLCQAWFAETNENGFCRECGGMRGLAQ